ncbi:MAG: hypothetical protein JNM25_00920 [Planctomycetes bacterium]|nr:hypothetical protein [Planctomycetota bacterium]
MRLVPFFTLLVTAPALAQDAVWRLPARGAAEYRRQFSAASVVAPTKDAARKAEAKGQVPQNLLPRLVMPPWLCQGELTPDQRAIGDEPRDLRDVLRAVACDLGLRSRTRLRYRRILPFGDLLLNGRVESVAADGRQAFTLDVTTDGPEVRPGETKSALNEFIRPLCQRDASGSLAVERTYDAAAGVVRSFTAELTLVFEGDKGKYRKLVVRDAWDLVALHDNQDASFRAAVAAAIVAGAKWVRSELADLGRPYMKDDEERDRSYGSGRIALGVLTLLHADVPADDPVVVAAFDELRRREVTDTYSLGVGLMAIAARYAPAGEIELLRSGALAAPKPRELSAADRELAVRWLAQLRQNVDTRVDPGYRLRFNYVPGPRFDNSVNQYGLLGLYSAQLCQLDVPAGLWRAAASHLLDVQGDDNGRQVQLSLTTHRDLMRDEADGAHRTRGSSGRVPARGFAYQWPDRPEYGSMTAAGITGLVIARAGMVNGGLAKADVMPKVDAAIQSGFAWLAAEFQVRSNPGFIDKADTNWFYYLYGVERACELAGVALVQDRDWYYEGALQLMALQEDGGAWPLDHLNGKVLDATCFAVLFLKKATMPAVTGG